MLALLALILFAFLPDADHDGDGYGARIEYVAGCSPLDRESFPTCQEGRAAGCSLTEPGFTPPAEPS